jgi:hypothetical protein
MKRKRLVWAGGILAGVLVGVPVLLWSGYALLALLRQEHFYHGLPSGWWRGQFARWRGYNDETAKIEHGDYERIDRLSRSWVGPVTDYFAISQPLNGFAIFYDPAAAPVLCDLVRDGDVDTRLVAAEYLARKQLHPEIVVPAMIAVLEANRPPPHHRERLHAMLFLRAFGPIATAAVPALLNLLNGEFKGTAWDAKRERDLAMLSLRTIDPDNMDLFIRLLEHSDWEVRSDAARMLGYHLGPKAKAAVPGLVKMLGERHPVSHRTAALMLLRIDPEAAHKAGVPKGYE